MVGWEFLVSNLEYTETLRTSVTQINMTAISQIAICTVCIQLVDMVSRCCRYICFAACLPLFSMCVTGEKLQLRETTQDEQTDLAPVLTCHLSRRQLSQVSKGHWRVGPGIISYSTGQMFQHQVEFRCKLQYPFIPRYLTGQGIVFEKLVD